MKQLVNVLSKRYFIVSISRGSSSQDIMVIVFVIYLEKKWHTISNLAYCTLL